MPDPTPATRSFSVDTGPPDTTINGGPSGTVNTTAQSFLFSGTEVGSTFQCRLDTPSGQGTYAACTSPQAYTTTANGAYTFSVRAIDAGGNVDPTPATRTFTVDTAAPDTTITAGPTGTDERRPRRRSRSPRRGGLDVRVQARRPGRDDRHVRRVHVAAARTARSPTAPTRSRSAPRDAAGNVDATPGDAHVHGRHRRAGHDDHGGPTGDERHVAVVHVHLDRGRARRSSASSTRRRATGTFAACTSPQAYTTTRGRRLHVLGARHRRGRQRRRDAGDADVHGRHGRAGHDDRHRPDRRDRATTRRRSRSPRARPARRSSASSTAGAARARRAVHLAADLRLARRRRVHVLGARHRRGGQRRRDAATRTFTVDTTAPDTTIDRGPTGTTNDRDAVVHLLGHGGRLDVRVQARRPGRGDRHLRALHVAAGLLGRCRRHLHVLGPRDRRRRQRRRDAGDRGRSRSTPPRRTRRSPAARPARRTSRSPSFAFTSRRGRLDVRVPLGRPARLRGLHLAAAYAGARRRRAHASRSAPPTPPATSTRRRPRGRSRSTPSRRTRRSPAARPARSNDERGLVRASRARRASTFECRLDGGDLRGLHVAAGLHEPRRRRAHVRGPRDRRRRQRRRDARDAHVHGRHRRAGHDDQQRPDRRDQHRDRDLHVLRHARPASTFECRLDAAAFATCTSPQTYTSLAQGAHTFEVRATRRRRQRGRDRPRPRTFTVDTVAPDTTINSGPTGTINVRTPHVRVLLRRGGLDVRVPARRPARLARTCCTSPRTLGPLADGTHTFQVRATDAAGNVDATPASRTFTVDTSRPDTTITSGPTGATNNASPSFAFTSTEAGLDVRVPLGRRGVRAVHVAAGVHGPRRRARTRSRSARRDSAGNVDPTPASRTFTVDTAAPNTTIDSGPTGTIATTRPRSRSRRARPARPSSAASTAPAPRPAPTAPAPRRASSARWPTAATRSWSARPTPPATSTPSPASRTFTVDTAAPNTTIDSRPDGHRSTSRRRRSRFSSTEAGLDVRVPLSTRRTFTACTSPQTYTGLADGSTRSRSARPTRPATSTRRPRRARFTVDTHRAGHDDHVRPDRSDQQHERLVRVHRRRGRLDVRVPHRRRDVRGLHLAAGLHGRWPRASTRSRSARPTRPATSTRRRRRARSRSTRPRRTRRSRAARPGPTTLDAATFTFTQHGAGRDVRVPPRHGRVHGLHLAAGLRRPWPRARTRSRSARSTRRATGRHAGHAHVHGRHDGAEHDDRLGPDGPDGDATPTFTFSSSRDRLDVRVPPRRRRTFTACASPQTYTGLADG